MNLRLSYKEADIVLVALAGMADETRQYSSTLTKQVEAIHARLLKSVEYVEETYPTN